MSSDLPEPRPEQSESPSTAKATGPPTIDLSASDNEEEEKQLRWAIAQSLEEHKRNVRRRVANTSLDDDEKLAFELQCKEEEYFLGRYKAKRDEENEQNEKLALALQHEEEEAMLLEAAKYQAQVDLAVATRLHEEELMNLKPSAVLTKDQVVKSLEPCQVAALTHVQKIAHKAHQKALPRLSQRVETLGYKTEDLDRCLTYIRNDAPIVIHLKENTLELLIKDTHYRNLFETKTSGGTNSTGSRTAWERSLFGASYDSCEGSLRPKYGCLNITGDIAGVAPARRYGPFFLILESHVRYRTTFSDRDTGANSNDLATHEYYSHVLERYNDSDLVAALGVSRIRGSQSRCATYKEVQIHGPVCLATDIQALSVPGRKTTASSTLMKIITEFQKKTQCNILWQGDLLDGEPDS